MQIEPHPAEMAARYGAKRSVKTTESGGPRGYDAGKKLNGRRGCH
jgi:hypothetical protein